MISKQKRLVWALGLGGVLNLALLAQDLPDQPGRATCEDDGSCASAEAALADGAQAEPRRDADRRLEVLEAELERGERQFERHFERIGQKLEGEREQAERQLERRELELERRVESRLAALERQRDQRERELDRWYEAAVQALERELAAGEQQLHAEQRGVELAFEHQERELERQFAQREVALELAREALEDSLERRMEQLELRCEQGQRIRGAAGRNDCGSCDDCGSCREEGRCGECRGCGDGDCDVELEPAPPAAAEPLRMEPAEEPAEDALVLGSGRGASLFVEPALIPTTSGAAGWPTLETDTGYARGEALREEVSAEVGNLRTEVRELRGAVRVLRAELEEQP